MSDAEHRLHDQHGGAGDQALAQRATRDQGRDADPHGHQQGLPRVGAAEERTQLPGHLGASGGPDGALRGRLRPAVAGTAGSTVSRRPPAVDRARTARRDAHEISTCQARKPPLTCANAVRDHSGGVLDWSPRKGLTAHMTFTVGETVVYPNHGAAVIEDIEMRKIKGEDTQYLVLRIVAQQDLVVRVPACNLDLVGVRDVVDKEGLDRVFDVLRAAHAEEPTNWSRRYKANLEKLHSGDVMKVAEVVRDLWRRERDRGLSAGEKRMLAKARQILVSELALAEHTNEDKAEAILDEVLAS